MGQRERGVARVSGINPRQLTVDAARRHGVPVSVALRLVNTESRFNPRAVSEAGAVGLTQLMPATAKEVGVVNRFDARQNVNGGMRYMARLLRRFDNNCPLAAAAYHDGPGTVSRLGRVPRYPRTLKYVRDVCGHG